MCLSVLSVFKAQDEVQCFGDILNNVMSGVCWIIVSSTKASCTHKDARPMTACIIRSTDITLWIITYGIDPS